MKTIPNIILIITIIVLNIIIANGQVITNSSIILGNSTTPVTDAPLPTSTIKDYKAADYIEILPEYKSNISLPKEII
jgi:hypothetical protein